MVKMIEILKEIEAFVKATMEKIAKSDFDFGNPGNYSRTLGTSQQLERLKFAIHPHLKKCKFCGEKYDFGKFAFYGDSIAHCLKQECFDAWCIKTHGPNALKIRGRLNRAVSASISAKGFRAHFPPSPVDDKTMEFIISDVAGNWPEPNPCTTSEPPVYNNKIVEPNPEIKGKRLWFCQKCEKLYDMMVYEDCPNCYPKQAHDRD